MTAPYPGLVAGPSLELLGEVRWQGRRVPGERVAALLSALARTPAGLSDARLVEEVWPDAVPANPVKALQVLVSRVRSQCGAGVVVRGESGYRLGLEAEDVDVLLLHRLVVQAESALAEGDPAAVDLSARALDLAATAVDAASGPRAALVADVRALVPALVRCRARALVATGRPAEALPFLLEAHEQNPGDAALLGSLLRAEAAVSGAAGALERYETYRRGLADRLGVDPDPDLQRLHQELLAADDPVRTGLRFDGHALLGREDDLSRIRAAMASGRLTTVVGPGGIGKTSIAQVLARESTLPRVHVVELVGVAAADDVVAEVGAVLGVRGSVTSRHALTPAQQADVRARIAQQLDNGPTLLVLDNCEHVLEASASLVAFLLATTRDLRVLATSRAPLRIGAERVVALTLLDAEDAAALFGRRVRDVRPEAVLDPATVAAVVERLDGLPLAIEIAAARVRTLSVEEVRRRLDDRFALLRSRDRGLPARHRTLAAVIEWSWDLLDAGRATRAGLAVGVPRRVRRLGGRRGGRLGRDRPGRDAGRALPGGGHRERRCGPDADAGDDPRVRGTAAGRRGSAGRRLAEPGAVGRGPRGPVPAGALHGGPGRGYRHPEPRGEQPHRRAAPRAGRGRRLARGPAGLGPRSAVDDHRRARPDLRGGRQRRARAQRLGPARRRPRRGTGGRRAAGDPPELAAGPTHGPAPRGVGPLGRTSGGMGPGGVGDVRRRW